MKYLLAALALAVPGTAFAQAAAPAPAPAPAPKADCCEKMKAEGKDCCCDGMDKDASMDHSKHGQG